ncbi:MAG: xanthine dehydrogenase accessory protein XdhC [Deltaproteobacteria bacterium]|nr:xanthine dehydrogenase accessory protein XdhC [Deltaproteobacteria bacterium]
MDLVRQVLSEASGRPACLATVVRTAGSSPRHAGAKMLIFEDGTTFGTIGGGRIELEVTRVGREVAAGAEPRRVIHHLVRDLAMCCGGSMELYLEPLSGCQAALRDALGCYRRRESADLITDMAAGTKVLRAAADPALRKPAVEGDQFVEPIRPCERVLLFGYGHVCRALGPLLSSAGFEAVVCDDNETGAIDGEVDWAQQVVASFEVGEVEGEVGPLGPSDFAVILTRDHAIDQTILEQLLPRTELAYLGLIGSHGKVGRFRKRLISKGLFVAEQWQRLHAPIGIDIGAETPAEIAISVAAELVAVKNRTRRGRQ